MALKSDINFAIWFESTESINSSGFVGQDGLVNRREPFLYKSQQVAQQIAESYPARNGRYEVRLYTKINFSPLYGDSDEVLSEGEKLQPEVDVVQEVKNLSISADKLFGKFSLERYTNSNWLLWIKYQYWKKRALQANQKEKVE